MSSFGGTIHHDELLWLLGSLSGPSRLPFDAAPGGAVLFSSPSTDQSATEATDPPPHTLLIILKIEGVSSSSIFASAHSQAPETITTAEAAARFGSELILVGKESATADDEVIPRFPVEKKAFGFSWFIPELLKHKKNLAGHPLRFPRHSVGRPHHPAFHSGDHRQDYCPPEQKHPHRPRPSPYHVHALQPHHDLAQAVSGAAHRQLHRRRAGQQYFRHLIPRQLKRVIKSLMRKQGQKQQQKPKQRWNRGSAVQSLVNSNVQLKLGGFLS